MKKSAEEDEIKLSPTSKDFLINHLILLLKYRQTNFYNLVLLLQA